MSNIRPVDPRAEKICNMIKDLVNKHKDEITEVDLDWTILTLERTHDGYTTKTQVHMPLFNMKFRQYT